MKIIATLLLFASALAAGDRTEILRLEEAWLHARDAATLERILAPDFIHVLPTGDFISKEQHIAWFRQHGSNPDARFRDLRIRIYGNVAIATGTVVAKERETVFTDVFVKRGGRWQAVNAQENVVAP
jgi:ketosteroid isomerase-like protein